MTSGFSQDTKSICSLSTIKIRLKPRAIQRNQNNTLQKSLKRFKGKRNKCLKERGWLQDWHSTYSRKRNANRPRNLNRSQKSAVLHPRMTSKNRAQRGTKVEMVCWEKLAGKKNDIWTSYSKLSPNAEAWLKSRRDKTNKRLLIIIIFKI